MDTRILIFGTQAAASAAVGTITQNMGLTGSTFLFALPRLLVDGRYYVPHPSDDAWLAGVSGYVVAAKTGEAAVGETGMAITIVECLALRDRFTNDEMGTLTVAASRALDQGDPRLQMLLDTMGAAVQLELTDPRVQTGFGGLVALGLLTPERAGVILAPVGMLS